MAGTMPNRGFLERNVRFLPRQSSRSVSCRGYAGLLSANTRGCDASVMGLPRGTRHLPRVLDEETRRHHPR
jgi:hypothetical protein